MKSKSAMNILGKTAPFIGLRLVANLAAAAVAGIIFAIILGIGYLLSRGRSGTPVLLSLIAFLSVVGIIFAVKRYLLYYVKAGHVLVMTEYMVYDKLPQGSQIEYAKTVIKENFVSTTVMAGVDTLVEGAVRQIMRWLNKLESFFSFIPGSENIFGIINKIIEISCNYVDEAILSYIFTSKGQNIWKSAADGVVLYAQSWKKLVKQAAVVAGVILVGRVAVFIVLLVIVGLLPIKSFFVVFVIALLITYALSAALIEPFATVGMIKAYRDAIEGQEVSFDMYGKLQQVSSKFKEIVNKQSTSAQS